jgi:hypothetical protein
MSDILATSGGGQASAAVDGWTMKMEVKYGKPSLFVTAPNGHKASIYLQDTPDGMTAEIGYGIVDVLMDGKWMKQE